MNFCHKDIFSPTLQQAAITRLPKAGIKPVQCASHQPVSLLNIDYKILFKILKQVLFSNLVQILEIFLILFTHLHPIPQK